MRCVGRDIGGLAGSHDRFCAAEGDLDLPLENGEHLLEIMAMGRRTAAGWNKHVDQAVAASGVFARQKDRVGISNYPEMGQGLIFIRSRKREIALKVVGRNGRASCCHSS